MSRKPKKGPREKDLTSRYMSGGLDEDRVDAQERFRPRNKLLEQEKTARTAVMRLAEESGADIDTLPIGNVVQVYSLFNEVERDGKTYLAVVRKTLNKVSDTRVIVGDRVRFRIVEKERHEATIPDELRLLPKPSSREDWPEAVIEQVLPRETILTRSESFKGIGQHPIVANAGQMLIVASVRSPGVKWGLIDRMLIAAQSGKLAPIICLNKVDLIPSDNPDPEMEQANAALAHYQTLGARVLRTSAAAEIGLDALRDILRGQETVLAGHSGVGKSTLINSVQPHLTLRTAKVSGYTDKGIHTTTSARRYPLDFGGAVIDTPGVKLFGLWGVTAENLPDFFPDVTAKTAPPWRQESYERILASLTPLA